jgi:hypothetical protein
MTYRGLKAEVAKTRLAFKPPPEYVLLSLQAHFTSLHVVFSHLLARMESRCLCNQRLVSMDYRMSAVGRSRKSRRVAKIGSRTGSPNRNITVLAGAACAYMSRFEDKKLRNRKQWRLIVISHDRSLACYILDPG